MPTYNASPAIALTPGDTVALVNNAATDSGVTATQQVHVGPSGTAAGQTVNVVNTTNQDATGEISNLADVAGDYKNASGFVVPSGTALPYNMAPGWLRFTFGTAPTSGSLVVSR